MRPKDRSTPLRLEPLEPRLMLSHDGETAWLTGDLPPSTAAGPPINGLVSPNPFPPAAYSTLANGMPILNSYPTAPASIYLDFDGDTGTSSDPFSEDSDGTTFNASEQTVIYHAWRRMSMFYSMFNVNVTTVQPNVGVTPTAWIVLRPHMNGGYSGVDVFPNTSPVAFADADYFPQYSVEGIAHEIGHDFGSWHISTYDNLGNKTVEYSVEFDALQGAIMGGSGGVVNKWKNWHSSLSEATGQADAATRQDDMAEIANDLAALVPGSDGYRPDDYAGTIATATPLATIGNTQAITGVIERLTDADAFSFASTGGTYNVLVGRDAPSPVDVKVSVYNAAGVLLASEDGDPRAQPLKMVNDAQLTLNLAAGTYYVVVESHGNYCDQGQYVVRVDPMAANWQSQDVGLTGVPGFANYDSASGVYTVAGSGADMWGSTDGFQFLYQTLSGSGSITATVTGMDDTADWAKAGIMIRESLADNAREAYLVITPDNGVQWSWRTATGGSTGATTPGQGTPFTPKSLRIVRNGSLFTAYTATPGGNFTQIGSTISIGMASNVYIGLVTSSVNNSQLNEATFANVGFTGTLNPPVTLNSLPTPSGLAVASATSGGVGLTWNVAGYLPGDTNGDASVNVVDYQNVRDNFGGSGLGDANGDGIVDEADFRLVKENIGATVVGYRIERSTDNVNVTQVGTTAANVGSFNDTGLSDAQRYFYRVRATNAYGLSPSSAAVQAATRAGAVSNLNVISYSASQLVLDWRDASGETSYRIERSNDGISGWTSIGTNAKNVPLFTAGGLNAGTRYFFRVVTVDAVGDSATSAVASGYTRLPAVTGLAFTTKASNQMVIQWIAVAGATSYTVQRSTDGTTYATLASGIAATTITDNTVSPLGEYYYRVIGVNANTQGVYPTPIFAASPAVTALPSPWVSQDIGGVGGPGAAGFSSGTFTIVGGGADIWGNSDEFRFTYVQMTGDGSITARVTVVDDDNFYSRAGVMIRQSLATNSKYAAMMLHDSEAGARFQSRASTGGFASETNGAIVNPVYWVRMARSGSTFTGSISPDGVNWTVVGTRTISMTSTVFIGLALTPRDDNFLNTSKFDNVSTTVTGPVSAAEGGGGAEISGPLLLAARTGGAASGRTARQQSLSTAASSYEDSANRTTQFALALGADEQSARPRRGAAPWVDQAIADWNADAAFEGLRDGLLGALVKDRLWTRPLRRHQVVSDALIAVAAGNLTSDDGP